jgi:LPPG:FO 2-phospho-L-lactate transferase
LHVGDVRRRISQYRAHVVAVSPIVGGKALKGPAAKILLEMGLQPTAFEVACSYGDLIDGIVIDSCDTALTEQIESLGLHVMVTDAIMKNRHDRRRLANQLSNLPLRFQNEV